MRGPLSRDRTGSCVLLASKRIHPPPPSSPRPRRSAPLRYDITVSSAFASFLLSPGMIFRCPPRVFSLSASLPPSCFLGECQKHTSKDAEYPIMVVEEVIEIFTVSSASRNFDATDIPRSCVIIYQHSFFLPACSIFGRISEEEREREREGRVTQRERGRVGDSTGSNFPLQDDKIFRRKGLAN